jgi:hypothetical protein
MLVFSVFIFSRHATDNNPSVTQITGNTPAPGIQEFPIELQLDSFLKAHVVDEVCFDKKLKSFLAHVAEHPHVETWIDTGWYIIDKYNFVQLENNALLLRSEGSWDRIGSIDVTGLQCKQQVVEPDWFKE